MYVELKFEDSVNTLVDYEFGKEVYLEQVKNFIPKNYPVDLVFSENIQRLSISFVQGFISEFVKDNDLESFYKNMLIIGNAKFVEKFYKYITY